MNSKGPFVLKNRFLVIFIFIATLLMSIGYASINSIILEFKGEAIAKENEGIFITDVQYFNDINANVDSSKIISAHQTNLNSEIYLSDVDNNSSITYTITVYNSTNENYYFSGVEYLDEEGTYSNSNIIFTLNGINEGDSISSGQYLSFDITFSYKDNILSSDNKLSSYLNFEFKRKFSITYESIENSMSYPNEIFEGETLQIDLSNTSITGITVYINDIESTDYTFLNKVLVIENVSANLRIKGENGYLDDYDVPVTEEESEFVVIDETVDGSITVSDLFNKEIDGINASNKLITRIEFDLIYTSSTGSKQSITSTLTHNGTNHTMTTDFNGKVSNQVITIVFDNLSIGLNEEFVINNSANKITNGNIQITTGEVRVYFQ